MMLAGICLDLDHLWPGAKVIIPHPVTVIILFPVQVWQVVRKVASLGDCEAGATVLERVAREHGCVGRVATIPQVSCH